MLNEIVAHKRQELLLAPSQPLPEAPEGPPPSFLEAIRRPQVNVIAEIKYASPSHGPFRCRLAPEEIAGIYNESGAAAISVLTDKKFFSGDLAYLTQIHDKFPEMPLLRKDFIIDRSQISQARAYGGSAYLLIAACLKPGELADLIAAGSDYQLDPLVEVHDAFELEAALESGARIIGVNNRNLKTFEVDIRTSFALARRLEGEAGLTLVAESGIDQRSQISELRDAGYSAFLIGTSLMNADDPGRQLRRLLGTDQ